MLCLTFIHAVTPPRGGGHVYPFISYFCRCAFFISSPNFSSMNSGIFIKSLSTNRFPFLANVSGVSIGMQAQIVSFPFSLL